MLITQSRQIFNDNIGKYMVMCLTPIFFSILDHFAGFSNYFLSDMVVKLNTLVYLLVQMPEKFHLDDAHIIFPKFDVSFNFIFLG